MRTRYIRESYSNRVIYSYDGQYICTDDFCSKDKAKYYLKSDGCFTHIYRADGSGDPIYTFDGEIVYRGDDDSGEKLFRVYKDQVYRYGASSSMYYLSDSMPVFRSAEGKTGAEKEKERKASAERERMAHPAREQQAPGNNIPRQASAGFEKSPIERSYERAVDAATPCFVRAVMILSLIFMPIFSFYLSLKEPDRFAVFFSCALFGLISSKTFIVHKRDLKRLFFYSWLISSVLLILFSILEEYTGYGTSRASMLLISLASPLMILGHNLFCIGVIYLFGRKDDGDTFGDTGKSKKPAIAAMILLIVILLFCLRWIHGKQRREDREDLYPYRQTAAVPTAIPTAIPPETGSYVIRVVTEKPVPTETPESRDPVSDPVIINSSHTEEPVIVRNYGEPVQPETPAVMPAVPVPPAADPSHIGELVTLGQYIKTSGYLVQPLEWYVISAEEGRTVLLTKDVVARGPYDYSGNPVPFDRSYIYSWLNTGFAKDAFAGVNFNCPYSLSLPDADEAEEIRSVIPLAGEATGYALTLGPFYGRIGSSVPWLTRSPASDGVRIAYVDASGEINRTGITSDTGCGVRPMLVIECGFSSVFGNRR